MPFECCVCGFLDTTSETGLRKAQRHLPLIERPDVLLLKFKTSYNWLCQFCFIENEKLIEQVNERDNFTPEEVYDLIQNGRTEMAKLVMHALKQRRHYVVCKHYVDPQTKNNVLHVCANMGYWHLARYVLQSQLDGPQERIKAVQTVNFQNHTPLSISCTRDNRDDLCLVFCKAGSDANHRVLDSTCLMRACASGQDMVIDILHRYGARLDDRSEANGRTALMKAALLGELDCVRSLLRAGADRKSRDFSGVTAAVYAERRMMLDEKYVDITRCLEYADSYFNRKRQIREHLSGEGGEAPTLFVSKRKREFVPVVVTDVQGSKWDAVFDEISDTVMYRNASSGMSTYSRPDSADEVWMREQVKRDEKEKEERAAEAQAWIEHFDELAFLPYWVHDATKVHYVHLMSFTFDVFYI